MIFHHKLLTREGRVLANGWTHPSSMTIFVQLIHKKCHPKRYHSGIIYHMRLNIIFNIFLGDRLNTKLGDHGLQNLTTVDLLYVIMREDPTYINSTHWSSIWLRARSHMSSHYTWGPVTTFHDFGSVSGTVFGHFFWALTISWSRLLARLWSGP